MASTSMETSDSSKSKNVKTDLEKNILETRDARKIDEKEDWQEYFDEHPSEDIDPEEFGWKEWLDEHRMSKGWKDSLKQSIEDEDVQAAKDMYDNLVKKEAEGGPECPPEIAIDLSLLSLYKLVLLLDDSTSMEFAEVPTGMEEQDEDEDEDDDVKRKAKAEKRKQIAEKRKTTLAKVLKEVITVYQCHRATGIPSIRFFNTSPGKKDVTKDKWEKVMPNVCRGVTKIGSELKRKILDPFVFKPTKEDDKLTKPLLVEGEKIGLLEHVIINCVRQCRKEVEEKSENAVSFQFAQIGRDKEAQLFLRALSRDTTIEKHIDCVLNSSLHYITDENLKWETLAQLLLGAITEQANLPFLAAMTVLRSTYPSVLINSLLELTLLTPCSGTDTMLRCCGGNNLRANIQFYLMLEENPCLHTGQKTVRLMMMSS
ncbi:hypothetical protein K440DRAFT_658865 [Wilcoxina mikolae CBS 423.85]|nr:hypothetical protein K440DRAFT_658865 [Wilcoxina mikolae CBS 423.85]